uniref:Uncharacterized protein n=1 Tax=Rhizophora mucronata TaxID=61149 RepID=A0A2P2QE52_RHIMU
MQIITNVLLPIIPGQTHKACKGSIGGVSGDSIQRKINRL